MNCINTYKIFLSTLAIIVFSWCTLLSQTPVFTWANSVGGLYPDQGKAMFVDDSGYVYHAGEFRLTADLDPGTNTLNYTSNGDDDIFIQKLDNNGNLIWVKRIGGTGQDLCESIVVDDSLNIYITGSFRGTVDFDPNSGNFNVTSNGSDDIFILKLNSAGNFVWMRQIGGSGLDFATFCYSETGILYLTGFFRSVVDFDPGIGTYNLTSLGNKDVFALKIDRNGNFIAAASIGGSQNDIGLDCSIDDYGGLFITGTFEQTVDFDPSNGTFIGTSNGNTDCFVLKLDTNLNFVWAKTFGGIDAEVATSIVVDEAGASYIGGSFMETVDFNPNSGTFNVTSSYDKDGFILKLGDNGSFRWLKTIESYSLPKLFLGIDSDNYIYTTGTFQLEGDFDPGPDTLQFESLGFFDTWIQKLDTTGNLQWAFQIGGGYWDEGLQIFIDNSNSVYLCGFYYYGVDFDPSASNFLLNSIDNSGDAFLAKYGQCFSDTTYLTVSSCDSLVWANDTFFLSGFHYDTLVNSTGCDSIVVLDLTIHESQSTVINIDTCDEYFWSATDSIYNQGGVYSTILTTEQGCDSMVQLNLTLNSITASITQMGSLLVAGPSSGTSYQWIDCEQNWVPMVGQNTQSLMASQGSYAVIVGFHNCYDTTDCMSIISGIDEHSKLNEFNLYPNPSNTGELIIEGKLMLGAEIKIYDLTGRMLLSETLSSSNQSLDISHLKPSTYVVSIKQKDGISTSKRFVITP